MSEELTKAEQLMMWQLFAAGGEQLLKKIEPSPKGTPHHSLARRGFLKTTPLHRSILLTLEDRGWRWIADSEPFPIGASEQRVTTERRLLQSLLRSIKRYAGEQGKNIQDLFRPEPKEIPRPRIARPTKPKTESPLAPDVQQAITSAFFEIAGRPARGNIRLSQLREKLADIPRKQVDTALIAMWNARAANLSNLDNPRDIETEGDAALKVGAQVFHVVRIAE